AFHFLGSLCISKRFSYAQLDLVNSFSYLNRVEQVQHSLAATFYPLGNNRFHLGGNAILFGDSLYKRIHGLFQAYIGFNAPQFFSMNVVYTYGGVYNFNLYNGALVENGYDLLRHKLDAGPAFTIKNRVTLYLMYQLELKTESTTRSNYISNGFSIGLKIKT